jgi:hypothetical protein
MTLIKLMMVKKIFLTQLIPLIRKNTIIIIDDIQDDNFFSRIYCITKKIIKYLNLKKNI